MVENKKLYIWVLLFFMAAPLAGVTFNVEPAWGERVSRSKKKAPPSKVSKKKRQSKSKANKPKKRRKGASKACPFGIGPMNNHRCSKDKEAIIAKVLGKSHVECYSKLFFAEDQHCNAKTVHSRTKAKNPNAGVGICALESDPNVRKANARGPNCRDISTFEKQVKCCADINRKHGPDYFGTIRCGKARRCG